MLKDHVRNGRIARLVFMSALVLLAAIPLAAQSQPSRQGGWQFELTPYAWLAGMSGVPIEPATMAEFGLPFRKPPFTALANNNGAMLGITLRLWQEALADHLRGAGR